MTALHGMKQNMKEFYGKYDTFILPALKFILAFVTFQIINSSLGFMEKLSNIFIVLILSILCSVLPMNMMVFLGFVLILGHCYALGVETAGFALILMIVLLILFLRFSGRNNVAFILTPIAFQLHIPAVLPIGCGLLSGPSAAVPAGCGVILYHFMKMLKEQESLLGDPDGDAIAKLQTLLDGLLKNQDMWLSLMAFVVVCLVVFVIRKMFMKYSWHIAIVVGCIAYLVIMAAGSMVLEIKLNLLSTLIATIASLVVGFILEFFVMGVDYSRSQNLQFEDDEYVYYVKAVPKSFVAAEEPKERNRKKKDISKKKAKPQEYLDDDLDEDMDKWKKYLDNDQDMPVEKVNVDDVDFEQQLENSLKDL